MIFLIVLLVFSQVMTDTSVDKIYHMEITSFKDQMSLLYDLDHVETLILHIENGINVPSNIFNNGHLTDLTELYINGYSLRTIENEAFNGLINIKYLVISRTKIEIIDAEMFNRLSNLESLDLESNSIKTVKGNFALSSLKRLDLRHNKLDTIDQEFFQNIPNLESVDLRDNLIKDINVAIFGRLAKLNTLYLSDNRLDASKYRLANVFKESGITMCPLTIDRLSFSTEGCENFAFKMVLQSFTENLKILYVITPLFDVEYEQVFKQHYEELIGDLERLSEFQFGKYDMTIYGNLTLHKYVLVVDKHFRVLSSKGFFGLSKIEHLYLGRNNITIIEDKAFNGLVNLRYLELHHNKIEIIYTETFNELKTLRRLHLQDNYIHTIYEDFNLPSLELLDLSHNRLKAISQYFFQTISNLGLVFLYNNLLDDIHDESFDPLTKLYGLDLDNNNNLDVSATKCHLAKYFREADVIMCPLAPDGLFYSAKACENVPIKTMLTFVSDNAEVLYIMTKEWLEPNIKILQYLNKTYGKHFKTHDITKYKDNSSHTNALVLDRYNLSGLPSNSFDGLSKLRELYLSRNNITTLESGAFSGLINLTLLNLEHNQIEIIDGNDFKDLRNLKHLILNSNLIRYVAYDFHLPSLNTLNLANNRLVIIDVNLLNNLQNVDYLDLSYNSIKYINQKCFKRLPRLKYIDLTNNSLNQDNDQFVKILKASGIRMCPLASDHLRFSSCENDVFNAMSTFIEK